ncbi:MAG: hypothetical protein MHM6MM_004030 [Cercozoa sp. M6MM]
MPVLDAAELAELFLRDDVANDWEEQVARAPYSLRTWLRYAEAVEAASSDAALRIYVYERALQFLPRSYKLWMRYLRYRKSRCAKLCLTDNEFEETNHAFERALLHLSKMPRVWLEYADFLEFQCRVTRCRRVYDRCLQALPITQHARIWPQLLRFVERVGYGASLKRKKGPKMTVSGERPTCPKTARAVYARYVQLRPEDCARFSKLLRRIGDYDGAALLLARAVGVGNHEVIVGADGSLSAPVLLKVNTKHAVDWSLEGQDAAKKGKKKGDQKNAGYQGADKSAEEAKEQQEKQRKLWHELCTLSVRHAHRIRSVDVAALLRSAIENSGAEQAGDVGDLWVALADYHVRLAQFEVARGVFEEALQSVSSVRALATVFDAYTEFEEARVSAKLQDAEEQEDTEVAETDILAADDVDMHMDRLDHLLQRRPLLVSSVQLRQRPNSIDHWRRRAEIFKQKDDAVNVVRTYAQALRALSEDAESAARAEPRGALPLLWTELARYYEDNGSYEEARQVLERAVEAPFATTNELCVVNAGKRALEVARRACALPPDHIVRQGMRLSGFAATVPIKQRVWKELRLWTLLADLEESFGTLDTTRAVYDTVMSLRLATPQLVLNYARLLLTRRFFDDAFSVLERGVSLFPFPHNLLLYKTYLQHFVQRYGSTDAGAKNHERVRQLFRQALHAIPSLESADDNHSQQSAVSKALGEVSKTKAERRQEITTAVRELVGEFVAFEESLVEGAGDGVTTRQALDVLKQGAMRLRARDRLDMIKVLAHKTAACRGIVAARRVWQDALENRLGTHTQGGGDDSLCVEAALLFAKLEQSVGEIDRARGIFSFAAQLSSPADPHMWETFWTKFENFEAEFGNEHTLQDFYTLKRTVTARTAHAAAVAAAQRAAAMSGFTKAGTMARPSDVKDEAALPAGVEEQTLGEKRAAETPLDELEAELEHLAKKSKTEAASEEAEAAGAANPDEVTFSDDDEDE